MSTRRVRSSITGESILPSSTVAPVLISSLNYKTIYEAHLTDKLVCFSSLSDFILRGVYCLGGTLTCSPSFPAKKKNLFQILHGVNVLRGIKNNELKYKYCGHMSWSQYSSSPLTILFSTLSLSMLMQAPHCSLSNAVRWLGGKPRRLWCACHPTTEPLSHLLSGPSRPPSHQPKRRRSSRTTSQDRRWPWYAVPQRRR